MYFSVDVEADGPIPGPVLDDLVRRRRSPAPVPPEGSTAADPTAATFYRELRPISDDFDPAALAVSGLDRPPCSATGPTRPSAMAEFTAWVTATAGPARPVVVAYPACYDWMFLYWYLIRFTGTSVFGHSGCLDLKTLYAMKADVPLGGAVKSRMPAHLLSHRPHTHHALDDAIEQAELFANLMRWRP